MASDSLDGSIGASASGPFDPQRAGREGQAFGSDFRAERHALGRAGEPEGDMNDVVAGRHGQGRLGEAGFDDQRMRAVRIGLRAEHPPAQPAGERRAAALSAAERISVAWADPAAGVAALTGASQRHQREQSRQKSPSRCQSASRRRKLLLTIRPARGRTLRRIQGGLHLSSFRPSSAPPLEKKRR